MRKLLAILLALSMFLSFAACGKDASDDKADKKNKKEETVGKNDISADGKNMGVASLSDEEIAEKYTELELLGEENEELVSELQSALSEIEGIEESFENGFTDEVIAEAKTVFINVFSNYVSDEDAEIYAEIYCAMLGFQVLMRQNPGFMDEIFEEAVEKGYDADSEEFWDYVKAQLSEYVPEWCVEPIVRPIYSAVTINSRTKTCVANQREIVSELSNHFYGATVTGYTEITIEYDGSNVNVTVDGDAISYEQFIAIFDEIPYCPAQGTIVIGISMGYNGNVDIECVCRDNHDNTDHSL